MQNYQFNQGSSDEYYTPKHVFDALNTFFDLDAAAPKDTKTFVPAGSFITEGSLNAEWHGFVWLNPPFGGRNSKRSWLEKMALHGNGIVLTPDRSSAEWWQYGAQTCDLLLNVKERIKFIRPDGSIAGQPNCGTTLFCLRPERLQRPTIGGK